MKKCSTCQEYKDESEFYADNSRRDGKGRRCKTCERLRPARTHPNRRPDNRRGDRSLPGARQRYKAQNRQRVIAWQRGYNLRHSEERKAKSKKYYQDHPEIYLAQKAIQRAVRHKVLPPVSKCTCADCGNQARHYHHSSYAEQHRLDVVALCSRCHKLRHMSNVTG